LRGTATALLTALLYLTLVSASAFSHSENEVGIGSGVATIDGVRSPGEWHGAVVLPVFSDLPGSQLYIMSGSGNLYLGLWVPDTTLDLTDSFPSDNQRVRLEVYDVAGRRISRIINSRFLSGTHTVHWDGRDSNGILVHGGVYFLKTQIDNLETTDRVLSIR